MARIRKTQDREDGLFPPMGLVRISAMLYDRLKRRVEKRLAQKLRAVTDAYLMEKYRSKEKNMIIGISPPRLFKKDCEIALTVFAIDRNEATVWLHFPIAGQISYVNDFLSEIVEECDLVRDVKVIGGKLEMDIHLVDGDMPMIDPRYKPDRYGRSMFSCATEVWKHEREKRLRVY